LEAPCKKRAYYRLLIAVVGLLQDPGVLGHHHRDRETLPPTLVLVSDGSPPSTD
jgi:hypothetical protein